MLGERGRISKSAAEEPPVWCSSTMPSTEDSSLNGGEAIAWTWNRLRLRTYVGANCVLFLIIRGLSDLAGGILVENIKEEYEAMAKDNAAKVLDAVLRVLAVESEE